MRKRNKGCVSKRRAMGLEKGIFAMLKRSGSQITGITIDVFDKTTLEITKYLMTIQGNTKEVSYNSAICVIPTQERTFENQAFAISVNPEIEDQVGLPKELIRNAVSRNIYTFREKVARAVAVAKKEGAFDPHQALKNRRVPMQANYMQQRREQGGKKKGKRKPWFG